MAFVKFINRKYNLGDLVKTTKIHTCICGYFEIGTKVEIIDIDPIRGYTIRDFEGNTVSEIGWII